MKQNSVKIAITGGIGSGKSTVSRILKKSGFKVFSCDEIYSDLLKKIEFINLLVAEFGNGICNSKGQLDRKKLSQIVFSDKRKLNRLNSLTHPIIMDTALKLMESEKLSFCEVPLLFEQGFENLFDNVIVVIRDLDKRIADVIKRDNLTEEEVIKRINSQFDYSNCSFGKYYVIHNNSTLYALDKQIKSILKELV